MSRSRRKPYSNYVCYFSNKKDKKWAHRAFRAKQRQALKGTKEFPYKMREVSDVWDFDSDGLATYQLGHSWDSTYDNSYWIEKIQRK